jgi:hypothetical protein
MIYPPPYASFNQSETWKPWKISRAGTPIIKQSVYYFKHRLKKNDYEFKLEKNFGIEVKRVIYSTKLTSLNKSNKKNICFKENCEKDLIDIKSFKKSDEKKKFFCFDYNNLGLIGTDSPVAGFLSSSSPSRALPKVKYDIKKSTTTRLGTPGPWKSGISASEGFDD